jgi:peroxiredoxin
MSRKRGGSRGRAPAADGRASTGGARGPSEDPSGAGGARAGARPPAVGSAGSTTGRPRPRPAGAHASRARTKPRRRNGLRWLLVAAVGGLALLGLRALPGVAGGARAAPAVGVQAPELQVRTLDGRKMSLDALRGKVVLVNFWATWCPPCRAEMPGFEQVWREKQGDGFVVLGLSADEGGSGQVAAFLGDRGITYPVAMASSSVRRAFGGVNMLPSSFLIDKHGVVRRTVTGVFDEHLLRQDVNRLLREPAS